MKKITTILLLLLLISCNSDLVIPIEEEERIQNKLSESVEKEKIIQNITSNPQLAFDFDSLRIASGYEVMNGPIIVDFNNNGRYDLIVNRRNMSRTETTYVYELLNPIVILDNGNIIEIPLS